MGQRRIKDPLNCPFCESAEKGYSSGWGGSPEFWEQMQARHLKEHCCPTCGQPAITPKFGAMMYGGLTSHTLDALWKENPWVLD